MDLFFYDSRENRCSISALAGALEADPLPGLRTFFPDSPAGLRSALAGRDLSRPAAAAFSFFTSQKDQTARLVGELRAADKGRTWLIAGGPHPSACPEETLALGFDYVITGEGELALPALLRALSAGKPPAPGTIKGRPAEKLEDFPPFPAAAERFGPIEITRGCPFGCSYCQTSYLFGGKPRHRPVENVLRCMDKMLSSGFREIRFITPDAFAYGSPDGRALNLPALRALLSSAGALAEKKGGRIYFGSFPSEVRPEHVTPETLELVKEYAANRRLVIGAQSGSPRLLKVLKRGHGPEAILRAARLCRQYRIYPYLDFIFGLPGERPEDETATMLLIEELAALGAMIHTHAFMPLPGTPLAGAPGAAISRRMEDFIKRMESRGKAFGKWRTQRPG